MGDKAKKWGKEDDAKLAELFRKGPRNGGISTKDISKPYIETIIKKHFPTRIYNTFAPLYRTKVRKWNVGQTLNGARSKYIS